jgi:hypothetical protein
MEPKQLWVSALALGFLSSVSAMATRPSTKHGRFRLVLRHNHMTSPARTMKLTLIVVVLFLMGGCGQQQAQQSTYQATTSIPAPPPRKEPADFAVAESGRLPADYKKKIDQYLLRNLKDPDSRKVAYGSTPYGGLVCGEVNAKNSYGGYTGSQPFYTIFDSSGNMSTFELFPPDAIKSWRNSNSRDDIGYKYHKFLVDCGVYRG